MHVRVMPNKTVDSMFPSTIGHDQRNSTNFQHVISSHANSAS